jgi:hypothetical protein
MVAVPNYGVLAVLLSDAGVGSDPASDAQASPAAAAEREMQAKYRGESVDDGDLGSLDDEPCEPRSSFYHPYG